MSRWVRVRAVWLWIRPLWSLVPGFLIWKEEWSSIICCDFFNLEKLALYTLWHSSGPLIVQIKALSTPTSLGERSVNFLWSRQDSTSLTHTKLIAAEKVDGLGEQIPFPLEQRDQSPMASPKGMTPGRFKGYTGMALANAEGLEGATDFQKWNCLEERDLGPIQGTGWCGAKAGAHTEIPLEVTSLYHVGRVWWLKTGLALKRWTAGNITEETHAPLSLCGPAMIRNPQVSGGEATHYMGQDPSCTVTPRVSNKQWPEGPIRVQVLFCLAFQRGPNTPAQRTTMKPGKSQEFRLPSSRAADA